MEVRLFSVGCGGVRRRGGRSILRSLPSPVLPALLFSALLFSGCRGGGPPLLDKQALLERFDWWDNRDWDWYAQNIPFFESPDPGLDATYYYRWELLTKHLVYGSPETGYTFTEFIDRPFWSGSFGGISCPLGHQAYEIRWLKSRRIIEDFARYWFETPGAEPRSYSNWYGDAMWATYSVTGDRAFLGTVYPHMETQVGGWTRERWDPDHEMFRWVGAWDGMETNINSRLTDDHFGGAEGYRPTLNSYLFADLMALSKTADLFGEDEKARDYGLRAEALKTRVQEELWDPQRGFFLHQFASDEKDGIRAKSLTYETGPYAGDPHGRELLGYVPWQFNLPDPGYEAAWSFLMDPEYFWAPFGPTGVERGDPQFYVSPQCCIWSGNAWPYATTQTLVALANLLNDYDQNVVDREDYFRLLTTYSSSHRMDGRPYIAEASDPFSGSWAGHNAFYHSEHYLHSGFVDLVISGLVGVRPRADDTLVVNPLVPEGWDYFALEGVAYHGHHLDIVWDRNGNKYGRGEGFAVYLNGRELIRTPGLQRVQLAIPPAIPADEAPRLHNYAVNNGAGHFPFASASSSHPLSPPFYAVDGNRWYHPSPPNRWVGLGGPGPDWFQVEFGVERRLTEMKLYFLDDGNEPPAEAVGEMGASGYSVHGLSGIAPAAPPASFDLQFWDGNGWRKIPRQSRILSDPAGRRANTVTFPEIRTAGVRAVFHLRDGAPAGLTELEAWGPGALPLPPPTAPITNLALNPDNQGFPKASASFTSEADAVGQAVDGALTFTRYSRNRWTAFGTSNAEDWLEVEFGQRVGVGRIELFLYGDGRGVAAPEDYRIEVWAEGVWEAAEVLSRHPSKPTAWAVNTVEIASVETDRIRVVLRHALPAASGLTELRIWE